MRPIEISLRDYETKQDVPPESFRCSGDDGETVRRAIRLLNGKSRDMLSIVMGDDATGAVVAGMCVVGGNFGRYAITVTYGDDVYGPKSAGHMVSPSPFAGLSDEDSEPVSEAEFPNEELLVANGGTWDPFPRTQIATRDLAEKVAATWALRGELDPSVKWEITEFSD